MLRLFFSGSKIPQRVPSRTLATIISAAKEERDTIARDSLVVPDYSCLRALPSLRVQSFRTVSFSSLPSPVRPVRRSFSSDVPSKTSKDGVVGHPIDFDVHSKIEGFESQIVTISLEPGQVLRAESGAMMYMTDGVTMNTTAGGGLSDGLKRMMTGQNFFISDYTYEGEPGTNGVVALGTDFPSKIIRLNVEEYGGKLVCQKGALL